MNRETLVQLRAKILRMAPGEKQSISFPMVDAEEVKTEAGKFCRARGIKAVFAIDGAGVLVERTEVAKKKEPLYAEMDALEVGQSKLYQLPPAMHQKIRMAATARASGGDVRLSCNREGDFIRVTRLPMTDAEADACGPIQAPARATKYDLERLSSVPELRFNVSRADQSKLRLAVHRQVIKTGWTIRARLQDDGSMLVYRTDAGATPAATPAK